MKTYKFFFIMLFVVLSVIPVFASGDHEGHDHVMGEKDKHVVKSVDGKSGATVKKKEVDESAPVKEIDFEAYQFGYEPEKIVVKKGDTVMLKATSLDVPHGIFIKEYGVNVTAQKDKVEVIKFTADKVGEFDIICSVYCGRGHHSMKAKLIVRE